MTHMAESPRKQLSRLVREQFWDQDIGWRLQNNLMMEARKLISSRYKDCLNSTEPIEKCYEKKAQEAQLDKAYRKIWGEEF